MDCEIIGTLTDEEAKQFSSIYLYKNVSQRTAYLFKKLRSRLNYPTEPISIDLTTKTICGDCLKGDEQE